MTTQHAVVPLLRRARVADAAAIQSLLSDCSAEIGLTTDFKGPDYLECAKNWCRQRRVWVDERAGAIAGAMVLDGREIFYLAVAARGRKEGVGRGLIKRAKLICRRNGWDDLQAKAMPSNVPIVRLLESEGFAFSEKFNEKWDLYSWNEAMILGSRSKVRPPAR